MAITGVARHDQVWVSRHGGVTGLRKWFNPLYPISSRTGHGLI